MFILKQFIAEKLKESKYGSSSYHPGIEGSLCLKQDNSIRYMYIKYNRCRLYVLKHTIERAFC